MVVSKRHRNNYGLKDCALVQSEANWVEREVCVQVEGLGKKKVEFYLKHFPTRLWEVEKKLMEG